ncbi:MAG: minor capsid protein [Lachnospiraceae bacterium]|nr:minor capsid protein [Lachnospiraceae bacterium]
MRIVSTVGCMHIQLDTKRIDSAIERAQNRLDERVLGDCTEYVPFLGGQLRSSGHIVEPGVIEWKTPYAHYQYAGELYLTEDGRSYAGKYEKKHPTGQTLHYHEPGTGDHWFERAKQEHGQQWIDLVKREVGRG